MSAHRERAKAAAAFECRVIELSAIEWNAVKQEIEDITCLLAAVMEQPVESVAVQELVARHHDWVENFGSAPAGLYRELGEMYAHNATLRAFYERHREGLADFLRAAIRYHADTVLTGGSG